jgi:TrmH family RNA methyltransferase
MILTKDVIKSRSNDLVKLISSLKDKKGREKNSLFLAEGEKLFLEIVSKSVKIEYVLVSEKYYQDKADFLSAALDKEIYSSTRVVILGLEAFEKVSTEMAPQGIVTVARYLDTHRVLDTLTADDLAGSATGRFMALMSLRDPGNLGAVIRTAVAFGVEHLILSSDCADIYNPKTVRSAMGGLFAIKISSVMDFTSIVAAAHNTGRKVFAAELTDNAVSLKDSFLKSTDIVVIGNEGHGIDPAFSKICDGSIYIPICPDTESLNASVAASIIIYEQSGR